MSVYTEGEVAQLLGMTHEQAIEHDGPRSALYGTESGSSDAAGVPTIARWWDVRNAQRRVLAAGLTDTAVAAAEAVGQGATQREAAEELQVSQRTVGRLSRSLTQLIVDDLNSVRPLTSGRAA